MSNWIEYGDALSDEHLSACGTLEILVRNNLFRKYLCRGAEAFGSNDNLCFFEHKDGKLSPESTVKISSAGEYITKMSLPELYYYMHLAYQRFVEDGKSQAVLNEFYEGLEYFRNACKIKCDENGNPILEGSSPD